MFIDRVVNEEELREKEGQWAYRLKTMTPDGLNANDFFLFSKPQGARAPLTRLDLFAFFLVLYSLQFMNAQN